MILDELARAARNTRPAGHGDRGADAATDHVEVQWINSRLTVV